MAQDEDSDDERPFFKVDTPDASPECTDDSVVFKIPGSDGGSPPTDEHQESGIGPVSRNTFGKHASSPQANGLHIKPFHASTPTKQRANLSGLYANGAETLLFSVLGCFLIPLYVAMY